MSPERGPEYLEIGLPVRHARRDRRVAPGPGRRRRRVVLPAHDDARPGAARGVGRRVIPNVTFPATAGPVRQPDRHRVAVASMTRRVALLGKPLKRRHSQVMHDAAFDAVGIDARYVLRELDEDEVEAAVAEARGPDWLGLGVTAPYKRLVAGLCDEIEGDARTIGAVNNVARTADGRLVGFNTDAPGFRAGVELALGRPARRTSTSSWRAPAGPRTRSCSRASAAGAARVTVGNRTARLGRDAARAVRGGSATGVRAAVGLDDPGVRRGARDRRPRGQRDDGRHDQRGRDDRRRPAAGDGHRVRPRLRPARDAAAGRGEGPRAARGQRVGDADRAGRGRVRALDRRGRDGRRHARPRSRRSSPTPTATA